MYRTIRTIISVFIGVFLINFMERTLSTILSVVYTFLNIYLYRTSLFECTVLGSSLEYHWEDHLSTTLISIYRDVLGSFSGRLYWFGSLPLCSFSLCLLCLFSIISISLYWFSLSILYAYCSTQFLAYLLSLFLYIYTYIYILITFLYGSYLYVLISIYIDSSIGIFLY